MIGKRGYKKGGLFDRMIGVIEEDTTINLPDFYLIKFSHNLSGVVAHKDHIVLVDENNEDIKKEV